jgi:aminopeptidase
VKRGFGKRWLQNDGASLVGEIALVPTHNRLAEFKLTFFHGLFDENVSSHMALGWGLTEPGTDGMTAAERRAAGMSTSSVHHDFMIGAHRATCQE